MGIPGLFGLILSYTMIVVLLLSLNLVSLWRWWIKAGAIVLSTGFVIGSYMAINDMLGWPATYAPPERFQVLSTRIVEPDKTTGEDGAIYLWIEEMDDNNVPLGIPRAFRLAYDDTASRRVSEVQERLESGEQIMGVVEDGTEEPPEGGRIRMGDLSETAELTAATDTVPFRSDGTNIQFEDLPPVILPDKGPI